LALATAGEGRPATGTEAALLVAPVGAVREAGGGREGHGLGAARACHPGPPSARPSDARGRGGALRRALESLQGGEGRQGLRLGALPELGRTAMAARIFFGKATVARFQMNWRIGVGSLVEITESKALAPSFVSRGRSREGTHGLRACNKNI
jgi:hypothetical protein